LIISLKFEGLV